MDIKLLIFSAFAVIAFFVVIMAAYLKIYKRNINKALTENSKRHIRMIPPYKVLNVLIALLAVVALAFAMTIIPSLNRISTADEIERETRRFQAINDEWNMEISLNDNLAVVLSYDDDMSEHAFSVYKNTGNVVPNYKFSYGGESTSIERSVRVFKYDNTLALLSMNMLHIAKIECHDGITCEIDPNSPFALIIPSGGFDVYDSTGNIIDLAQDWWYEITDTNDNA